MSEISELVACFVTGAVVMGVILSAAIYPMIVGPIYTAIGSIVFLTALGGMILEMLGVIDLPEALV